MQEVYIAAYEYEGGGGFDWYYNAEQAVEGYDALAVGFAGDETLARYFVTFETYIDEPDARKRADAITADIDSVLWDALPDDRPLGA